MTDTDPTDQAIGDDSGTSDIAYLRRIFREWRKIAINNGELCRAAQDREQSLRTAITAAVESAAEEDLDKHPRTGAEFAFVGILREALETEATV